MSHLDPESVPADDRGLLLGDGLFETVRLYAGRPFRLGRHLQRLTGSAEALGIPFPADLEDRVRAAMDASGEVDGALRITLTRGSGAGLAPPPEPAPRLLIGIRRLDSGPSDPPVGLRARLIGRVDEYAITAGHKALGYLERIEALRRAKAHGADEALLRNGRGVVVEGSASNLVGVRAGTLIAPGPPDGALPGITREVLLEVAHTVGFHVEERGISPEELSGLSEIFLTSSLREIVPVVDVGGALVGDGVPGAAFESLAGAFRNIVLKEVAE